MCMARRLFVSDSLMKNARFTGHFSAFRLLIPIALTTILSAIAVSSVFSWRAAAAEVPVVDLSAETGSEDPLSVVGMDRGSEPVYAAPPVAGESAGTSPEPGANATLFYQLQVLRDEVQELRGMVEEQAHQIDRLAKEQKEQYLDLDRRLSSRPRGGSNSLPVPDRVPPNAASKTERDAYAAAFQLTREKRFQEAIDRFNQLIVTYPNGQYTANAFYWLGELYLALPEPQLEKSRQSFVQVVNLYPDTPKLPDALYKLGVIYDRLGDREKSLEYLNRVIAEYPNSPASRLASTYKSEMN